ncbi:hypothetical protein NDI52_28970 [Leptolyngbya sp. PL-A3]|uniref:hypothetical protein n=1 Tax=Leptolyngbya sp. PL-A3 TaxID=2933911 RepID=UPI0032969257
MANTLKNPGLGNSGSFGITMLVLVTRIGLVVFCVWNATLYYKILMSFFAPEGFFKLLIGFVALVLWALLQVLEVLPLLVKGSLGALALLIKAAERFRGLEVNDKDNPLVASLKTQYNAFPQRWIGRIMLLCYAAFCTDLAILLRYFKPFVVSFTGLVINWGDLLWLVICLSTVQVVCFLWLLAEGGRAIFKPEKQPTTSSIATGSSSKPKQPTKSAAPPPEEESSLIKHLRKTYGDEAVDQAIAQAKQQTNGSAASNGNGNGLVSDLLDRASRFTLLRPSNKSESN